MHVYRTGFLGHTLASCIGTPEDCALDSQEKNKMWRGRPTRTCVLRLPIGAPRCGGVLVLGGPTGMASQSHSSALWSRRRCHPWAAHWPDRAQERADRQRNQKAFLRVAIRRWAVSRSYRSHGRCPRRQLPWSLQAPLLSFLFWVLFSLLGFFGSARHYLVISHGGALGCAALAFRSRPPTVSCRSQTQILSVPCELSPVQPCIVA